MRRNILVTLACVSLAACDDGPWYEGEYTSGPINDVNVPYTVFGFTNTARTKVVWARNRASGEECSVPAQFSVDSNNPNRLAFTLPVAAENRACLVYTIFVAERVNDRTMKVSGGFQNFEVRKR